MCKQYPDHPDRSKLFTFWQSCIKQLSYAKVHTSSEDKLLGFGQHKIPADLHNFSLLTMSPKSKLLDARDDAEVSQVKTTDLMSSEEKGEIVGIYRCKYLLFSNCSVRVPELG